MELVAHLPCVAPERRELADTPKELVWSQTPVCEARSKAQHVMIDQPTQPPPLASNHLPVDWDDNRCSMTLLVTAEADRQDRHDPVRVTVWVRPVRVVVLVVNSR